MASVAVAPQCDPPGLFFMSESLLHRKCRSSYFVCNFADVRSPCRISAAKCARRLSVQAFAGRDDAPDSPSKCVDVAEGPTEMENVGSRLRSRSRSVQGNSEYVRSKPSSKTSLRSLSGFDWIRENNRKLGAILSDVEAEFFKCISHIGECMAPIIGSGFILGTALNFSGGDCQLDMLVWSGWLVGILAGIMIGTNQVLERRCKSGTQNVVITGSTRGLGKALAREFLFAGDNVVVASRSAESVRETVAQLHQELTEGLLDSSSTSAASCKERGKVIGIPCDVSKTEDVKELAKFAISELGSIDIWINNAGTNKGFKPLLQISDEDINQIVSTNLVGSIICTKEAIRVMKLQEQGGHVFNMDGAGSGGSSTPLTAVYGSTKCGLRQLNSSLLEECRRSKVGIHTASPGMVLTDLLLSGSTLQNKKAFNIICELPETVARALVPRMRGVKGTGKAINYLTPPRILLALITAWVRRGRWFDEQGRALFAAEADRIRNWAENRARFSISDAMDIYSDGSWVSVFSFSVVCAFILLSSSVIDMPGS